MSDTSLDGARFEQMMKQLPKGRAQLDILPDYIRQADQAQDYFWQMTFRSRYCYEATFRDDPPKAIPMAAEFCTLFEAHEAEMMERCGEGIAELYLMILQMGIDPMVNLPQIPRKQWEQAMDHFYRMVQKYQIGLRTYWWQMTRFWQYIDRDRAYTYFQKFWESKRDSLSDCPACEHSYGVRMSLLMGDRAAADAFAKPMEEGRLEFCGDTPQLYWLAYLEDALDQGDRTEAAQWARALIQRGNRDRSDLSYVGAVLRCWAHTDLKRALKRVERRLEWTIGMWDQKKVYDFYKGAWACFHQLSKEQSTAALTLPHAFPLWRSDGQYDTAELARWFHTQAENIAQRFDARNGSRCFALDLERTLLEP